MNRRDVLKSGVLGMAGLSFLSDNAEAKNTYPWISIKNELPDKLKNIFLLFIKKDMNGKTRCRVNFYINKAFNGRVWYGRQEIPIIFVNGEKMPSGFSTLSEYKQLIKNGGYADIMWKYTDQNVQLPDVGELPKKQLKFLS